MYTRTYMYRHLGLSDDIDSMVCSQEYDAATCVSYDTFGFICGAITEVNNLKSALMDISEIIFEVSLCVSPSISPFIE